MIWIALSSWTGLATNQAYDRGLTYNRNLDAAAAAGGAGLAAGARGRAGRLPAARSSWCSTDAAGQPVTDAEVVVRFERPTSEGLDFAVTLAAAAPGVYRGGFVLPPAGAWNLHATIRRGDDLFVHDQRVVLP